MALDTIILGGGISGASLAYHLSARGATSTILESQARPATLASGRAAGFLARNWADGSVTERLHRTSFDMHAELANTLELTSYRRLIRTHRVRDGSDAFEATASGIGWLDNVQALPIDGDAAQVEPAELAAAFLRSSSSTCTVRTDARVVGLECGTDDSGQRVVTAVALASGVRVPVAGQLVVALGPWSCLVESWLEVPMPIEGAWSTSCIYAAREDPSAAARLDAEPAAIFCDEDARGCRLELYPRPGGALYVSGCGSTRVVSPQALRADELPPERCNQPDASRAAAAHASLASLSTLWRGESGPATVQACMRPCAPDNLPVIGALPGCANVHVLTGGGPWGVLWAPVMGKAMAELLLDGEAAVCNVRPFAPRRFDKLTYRTLMRQRG